MYLPVHGKVDQKDLSIPCVSSFRSLSFHLSNWFLWYSGHALFFQPSNRPVPKTGRLRYMTSILECFFNNLLCFLAWNLSVYIVLSVGVAILKIAYRIIVHFTGNLCQIQAFLRSYLSGHRQTKKSAAALEEGQRAKHDQKAIEPITMSILLTVSSVLRITPCFWCYSRRKF